jgi:hypothetical protein
VESDSSSLSKPKRCASHQRTMELNQLKIITEIDCLPEFGVKYDHMFAFGNRPQQFSLMGMVTDALVYKMNKATINSIKIKTKVWNGKNK